MPTKKGTGPRATARFNFFQFLMLACFDWPGVERAVAQFRAGIWDGGLDEGDKLLRLFDPHLKDLAKLPLGLLVLKGVALPTSLIPASESELLRFCRRLIHRGEDEEYIALVVRGWRVPVSLEAHVRELWFLRSVDPVLFELIVRGLFGDALAHFSSQDEVADLSAGYVNATIARHELLWSANDVQTTAARARVSFRNPFGSLMTGTMRVFKVGTALRLMRGALELLKKANDDFQTSADIRSNGRSGAEPKGAISKAIAAQAAKRITAGPKPLDAYQRELDDSMHVIASRTVYLEQMIDALEAFNSAERSSKRSSVGPSNKLMLFHAIWYSGLTPAAGVMVGCIRMAMAERYVEQMVERAAPPPAGSNRGVREVDPLPALPQGDPERQAILERALDLTYGARRVVLRDDDWRSRLRVGRFRRDIGSATRSEAELADRDPTEKIGPFAIAAITFVDEMGGRAGRAHRHPTDDDRALTYYHMDVTPEERLCPRARLSEISG